MIRLSRDAWLAIGLVAVLIVITVGAALLTPSKATPPPLASDSSAPDGALALNLWLEKLGYAVNDTPPRNYTRLNASALLLVLEPIVAITEAEWEELDAWVDKGGTLLIAGERFYSAVAADHFDFNLDYAPISQTLTAQTPLLAEPPLISAVPLHAHAHFLTERTDFLTLFADEFGPVSVTFVQGQGRVILSATPYPFSNAGLKETGNSALVLNLVGLLGQTKVRQVWFDEWHHGRLADTAGKARTGPEAWLTQQPAGQALLYIAVVLFVALVLRGQRFGRPVPLPQDLHRRAPLEYITAIANLNRRAGLRAQVLKQYHQRLKRELGQRYRLDPTLPDEDYVRALARFNPNLDTEQLRAVLAQLSKRAVNENELIHAARAVAAWLKEKT